MKLVDFKSQLMTLAEDETVELRKIQALITKFFKNKSIPCLQSISAFVVRCSINKNGEVFENASRCSYPPDECKDYIKIQRANYPKQQVFYCSMPTDSDFTSASATCIVETAWEHIEDIKTVRTYLTLSRWSTKRPLMFWVLPFSNLSCEKNKDFETIRNNITKIINEKYNEPSIVLEALEFISNAFCERNNKKVCYRITSAFYNSLLFYEKLVNKSYDGLMYPSANTEGAGLNMVIKKELIDNRTLYCDYTIMLSIQRLPNNPKSFHIMSSSNPAIPEKDDRLRFTSII